MGFFDFIHKNEENNNKEPSKKLPITVRTNNIQHSIHKIADMYNISIARLDFDLINVFTYVKEDVDFELIDDYGYFTEERLLNEEFKVKQSYEIEVKYYEEEELNIKGDIFFDEKYSEVYYIIYSAEIEYEDDLEIKFTDFFNKLKVYHQILINIFDENMKKDIKKLVTDIFLNNPIENRKINLCSSIKYVEPINKKIIEEFKNYSQDLHLTKHSIFPIQKDQVAIKIIKPKLGKDGRNCQGKFIKAHEPIDNIDLRYSISNSFYKDENEEYIYYKAKRDGYITIENNELVLKNDLEIRNISLKTVGDVDVKDKDVKINVKENSVLKEAVASNMIVKSDEINVNGNVASNAYLEGKKIYIKGLVHKNAKIKGHKVNIHLNKGSVIAEDIHIDILEYGKVKSKILKIDTFVGGEVEADKVYINQLHSNGIVYAYDFIDINEIKGEDNHLIIDFSKKQDIKSKLENKEKKLKSNLTEIETLQKDYQKISNEIKKISPTIKKINNLLKDNVKISVTFVKLLKQYKIKVKQFEDIKNRIDYLKQLNLLIKDEIELLKYKSLDSFIKIDSLNENNIVEFKLVDEVIRYETKKNDKYRLFKLKKDNDKFIIIKE